MPQLGPSALEAFQIGTSLRGPSALGQFAMALTERLNKMSELRMAGRIEGEEKLRVAKPLAQIETEEKIRAAGPVAEAEAAAKAKYDPMLRVLLESTQSGTSLIDAIRSVPLRPGEELSYGPFKRGVPAPTLERGTAVTSASNVIQTIKGMRQRVLPDEGGDPKSLLLRGVPGVGGAMTVGLDFDTVKLEVVTARGGKQLTPSEQLLIQRVIPDRMMIIDAVLREQQGDADPYGTVRDAFDRLERLSQALINYFDPNIGEADIRRIERELGTLPSASSSSSVQDQARRTLRLRQLQKRAP